MWKKQPTFCYPSGGFFGLYDGVAICFNQMPNNVQYGPVYTQPNPVWYPQYAQCYPNPYPTPFQYYSDEDIRRYYQHVFQSPPQNLINVSGKQADNNQRFSPKFNHQQNVKRSSAIHNPSEISRFQPSQENSKTVEGGEIKPVDTATPVLQHGECLSEKIVQKTATRDASIDQLPGVATTAMKDKEMSRRDDLFKNDWMEETDDNLEEYLSDPSIVAALFDDDEPREKTGAPREQSAVVVVHQDSDQITSQDDDLKVKDREDIDQSLIIDVAPKKDLKLSSRLAPWKSPEKGTSPPLVDAGKHEQMFYDFMRFGDPSDEDGWLYCCGDNFKDPTEDPKILMTILHTVVQEMEMHVVPRMRRFYQRFDTIDEVIGEEGRAELDLAAFSSQNSQKVFDQVSQRSPDIICEGIFEFEEISTTVENLPDDRVAVRDAVAQVPDDYFLIQENNPPTTYDSIDLEICRNVEKEILNPPPSRQTEIFEEKSETDSARVGVMKKRPRLKNVSAWHMFEMNEEKDNFLKAAKLIDGLDGVHATIIANEIVDLLDEADEEYDESALNCPFIPFDKYLEFESALYGESEAQVWTTVAEENLRKRGREENSPDLDGPLSKRPQDEVEYMSRKRNLEEINSTNTISNVENKKTRFGVDVPMKGNDIWDLNFCQMIAVDYKLRICPNHKIFVPKPEPAPPQKEKGRNKKIRCF